MNINRTMQLAAAGLFSISILQPLSLLAQGALTPPGPPAPTMKSLSQIEARTPISTAPIVITTPGSYYLTTNLSVVVGSAIYVAANQVSLDLNGFTISSTDPGNVGAGIMLSTTTNSDITILNGHINGGVTTNGNGVFGGPGFASGIAWSQAAPNIVRVTGVSVSGCLTMGISLGNSTTVVESCTVATIGIDGITAGTVSRCSAQICGGTAITAEVVASDCFGDAVGTGNGISGAIANNSVGRSEGNGLGVTVDFANNCIGVSVAGSGLNANKTASNCTGSSLGGGTGLTAAIANGCYGSSSSGIGITAQIASACVVGGGTTNITSKYNMP
jgi:hypothetical protein